jgi:hypothetical protein
MSVGLLNFDKNGFFEVSENPETHSGDPAIRLTLLLAIFRIWLFPVSAMNKLPLLSQSIPQGELKNASSSLTVAPPLFPACPCLPAIIFTLPPLSIFIITFATGSVT